MRNKLTLEEIEEINKNEWLILASSDLNNRPRAVIVLPSRVEEDQIILSNIQMNKTIANIESNPNCFINVYIKEQNDKQIKIDCVSEVYKDGSLFEEIKTYEESNNLPEELKVNSIIVAKIINIEVAKG